MPCLSQVPANRRGQIETFWIRPQIGQKVYPSFCRASDSERLLQQLATPATEVFLLLNYTVGAVEHRLRASLAVTNCML